jgi:hypothetical protein
MNLNYERDRIQFIIERDGLTEGRLYAKRLMQTYTRVCKFLRKSGNYHHPMRFAYIQCAYSARHILRSLT